MKSDVLLRNTIFAVAGNPIVSKLFRKYGMKFGVSRFVAAESLEATVEKVRLLNEHGLMATLDFLGESVSQRSLAVEAAETVIRTLETIHTNKLQSNVSVKLTQLGLNLDAKLCLENMDGIVAAAEKFNNFVRIDMEDSTVTDQTLSIYRSLLLKFGVNHVGVVIQAYLYRSVKDIVNLKEDGTNVRFVKGAYKEPIEVAFPQKMDVDANYIELVKNYLLSDCYTAIATHDTHIIEQLKTFIAEKKIHRSRFEFQMLYGIRSSLQKELVEQGYRVRVYTPFGEHWYPYFTRRIAERPANLWFVVKSFLRK